MKINRLAATAILAILGITTAATAATPTRKQPVRARKAAPKRARPVVRAAAVPKPKPQPQAQPAAASAPVALAAAPAPQPDQIQPSQEDARITQLRNFFLAQRSPLAKHAEAFLCASDKYNLDWRLLPSLAMVETGGLIRSDANNNVFGWGNGRIKFASISESIQVIAERLTNALPYRNKNIEDKLRAYNPVNKSYATHVQGIMTSIGPAAPAELAAK